MNIKMVFSFLGGLGLFIYGMSVMATGIEKAAGPKMKNLLAILTKNKFSAVLVGAITTAIVQSSSTTTVMIVGFVNAGLMTLSQSVGVIMGANIGTTATAWIFTSSEWATFLKPTTIAPICVAIGVVMALFSKKENIQQTGEVLLGFGILFIGMTSMSDAVSPLKSSPYMQEAFATFGTNPILGVLVGIIVTAMVQSSSASVGILLVMVQSELVPWNAAVYIIMGQNIGTCVTALLSSIGTTRNAKAAAYIHLLFNFIGSVIFTIIAVTYFEFINPDIASQLMTMIEVSIVHTSFNVLNTIMLYPFSGFLVKTAEKMAATKKTLPSEIELVHLDERMLETPSFAIEGAIKEIARFGNIVLKNLKYSTEALIEKDIKKIKKVIAKEQEINEITHSITRYLVHLCNQNITEMQNETITTLLNTVNDIERIGDHAENIVELANELIKKDVGFTEEAIKEIKEIICLTHKSFEQAIDGLENNNSELISNISDIEEEIDNLEIQYRKNHIKRLTKKSCDQTSGIVFLDTMTNLERISDHSLNIIEATLKI
jgi:phosphate:Na+ symporter